MINISVSEQFSGAELASMLKDDPEELGSALVELGMNTPKDMTPDFIEQATLHLWGSEREHAEHFCRAVLAQIEKLKEAE